ncbi:hypothetical protein [Streptomyces longispororuber]|uniref:hypothetical protein n=1 Tax=Streptomyces longispororuber TaxID=68230 RepID=UPI00210C361E|nr:hypothetical protein [Streptomyces longispororuber]MCQ4205657.1 hypothetical protein [Streptomyces longispororuber]
MTRRRAQAATAAALILAATMSIGACGAAGTASTTPTTTSSPATAPGNSTPEPGAGRAPSTGPTSGWGPGMWNTARGPGMRGNWGPGMTGPGTMGNWWLAGDGHRVQTLDQARQRAVAFADRLGLSVGEIMQFSRNFYAELETVAGRPATEVLVNPADGTVQIEYGPAMMWNTAYGMRHGTRGGPQARISATEAQQIAQQWLRDHRTGWAAGNPTVFPGYCTLHTTQSGRITGMLSVNATTGQVWYHAWHGTHIASSRR